MELMALNLAIKSHNFLKGTLFHESLAAVQNKIKATLEEKHQKYINSIANMFVSTFRPLRDYSRSPKIIEGITNALLEKKRVQITYWTPSREKLTKRKIEPYRLWFVNGAFYIVGYCHYRKEVRIFLLDRIREVELTDETFTIPADFDFSQYTTKAFKVLAGDEDFEVVVKVNPLLRPQIMEQQWHPTQKVEELSDGWLKVSFRLSALDEIKTWIQGYAPFIVVEKPPELVEEVVNSFKEAIKLHKAK
jgi:predicted DNA-binding transcriptional regulator YafY